MFKVEYFFKFLPPLSRSPYKNILEALQDLHCFLRISNLTISSYQLLKLSGTKPVVLKQQLSGSCKVKSAVIFGRTKKN